MLSSSKHPTRPRTAHNEEFLSPKYQQGKTENLDMLLPQGLCFRSCHRSRSLPLTSGALSWNANFHTLRALSLPWTFHLCPMPTQMSPQEG